MNRRIRNQSSSSANTTNYLRYLRPGALAQLRDSKLKAKSQIYLHRIISSSPPSSPSRSRSPNSSTAISIHQQEVAHTESPNFSVRFYAPRCPQRKKLMAIRSMYDGPESVIDGFSTDFLVAH